MAKVTIAENGFTTWRIISQSDYHKVCRFAVDELRRYLKQINGCQFPPGYVGESPYAIVVGLRSDLPTDEATMLPASVEGYDGYSLLISENRVIIGGDNERGVLYGVYDLLERLGCRWFYPQQDSEDTEVVPRLDLLDLKCASMSVASPIEYRICNASAFFFDIHPDQMKAQLDNAMKARYNGMGWQCDHRTFVGDQYKQMVDLGVIEEMKKRGMLLHGPAHSFQHFLRNDDYFESHPEWFGMRDGKRLKQEFGGAQFCWSNIGARKQFVDNVEKFVHACPGLDILCSLGFDGGQACECPECKKSTPADLMLTIQNQIVERLEQSAPHVVVEMSGGYSPVDDPPLNTKPNEKLRVIWAHWGRYMGYGYDDPRYDRIANLETWRKAYAGRLTLCQYYTDNFATPWISAPYTIVLEGDRKYVRRNGVSGMYMLVYPEGYWWNHSFNNYMAGVCYYDFSKSPYEVLSDYAVHYYGPNAGPLLAAYYGQWARDIDLCYNLRGIASDQDKAMLAQQRQLYINPAVEAVKGNPVLAHRVGKVEKLHDLAERLEEFYQRRDKIEALRVAGDFEKASELLEKVRTHKDQLLAHMKGLSDLNIGLIDGREVDGFIKMGLDNQLDEESKAIAARSAKKREW